MGGTGTATGPLPPEVFGKRESRSRVFLRVYWKDLRDVFGPLVVFLIGVGGAVGVGFGATVILASLGLGVIASGVVGVLTTLSVFAMIGLALMSWGDVKQGRVE